MFISNKLTLPFIMLKELIALSNMLPYSKTNEGSNIHSKLKAFAFIGLEHIPLWMSLMVYFGRAFLNASDSTGAGSLTNWQLLRWSRKFTAFYRTGYSSP
jgi:hypothetical protein